MKIRVHEDEWNPFVLGRCRKDVFMVSHWSELELSDEEVQKYAVEDNRWAPERMLSTLDVDEQTLKRWFEAYKEWDRAHTEIAKMVRAVRKKARKGG